MPTVPELRLMAKERGLVGTSKMVKAELEEALGLQVTGAPRTEKAPAAKPALKKPAVARKEGDLLQLIQISDDGTTTYLIPFSEIKDFEKLKAQIKIPLASREVLDKELGMDYVELMIEKAQDTVESDSVYEVKEGQRIAYTAVVDCQTPAS
jgi:hypothetical protein